MTNFSQARKNMVDGQVHTAGVVDPRILDMFSTVPRELFVPEKLQGVSYTDENLDIGQGRCLMEPITHARLLQEARLVESDVVLDIAAGSGYSSAILSPIVSTVIALENNKRQMDKAQRVWDKLDMCNIVLETGKLNEGVTEHAPYSLIVINGSVPEVPDVILKQLAVGGRLVTVIAQKGDTIGQAKLFYKNDNGDVSSKTLFDTGIPFLADFGLEDAFQFA
ncbi:MAG: protein-L-isoaspartate O-methyltransferase family protein [Alphaproteobacteria bacterium]